MIGIRIYSPSVSHKHAPAILIWGEKPSLDMSPSSTGAETGMAAVGNDSVQGI